MRSPMRSRICAAFVTVQRGCSYYCTFCIVPHVRGRFDHRPTGEIVDEVREKIASGAREVMLVGQTVNAWKDPATGADFGDLCKAVAALPGLERLTFISPHPKDFTEKIIADLADVPQLNPRVHLPLQSGSDAMLRRMNRKYTMEQFREKVELIHRYLPGWAITTDIIVGFPGETEADFDANARLCRDRTCLPTRSCSSIRSVAARRRRAGNKSRATSPRRALRACATRKTLRRRAYHDRKIGTTVRALISGPSKKDANKLAAKTLDNVTVIAPMPDDYDEALYAREPWLDVEVETAHVWGCTGTIVRRAERFADAGQAVVRPAISLLAL